MQSRTVLFPEGNTSIEVFAPDDAADDWVVTFGNPGSRAQIHTDRTFLDRLLVAIADAVTGADK